MPFGWWFTTDSTLSTISADETHPDHAIIEQIIAGWKSGRWRTPRRAHSPRTPPGWHCRMYCVQHAARRWHGRLGRSCIYPPTGPGHSRGKTSGRPPPPPENPARTRASQEPPLEKPGNRPIAPALTPPHCTSPAEIIQSDTRKRSPVDQGSGGAGAVHGDRPSAGQRAFVR